MASPGIYLNAEMLEEGINMRNMALEDTVNTEAFVSPKNDMFTSSPNDDDHIPNIPNIGRDANIIHVKVSFHHCFLIIFKLNLFHRT